MIRAVWFWLAILAIAAPASAADPETRARSGRGTYVVLEVDMNAYWQGFSMSLGDKAGAALNAHGIANSVQVTPQLVSICLQNAAAHDKAQAIVIAVLKPEAARGQFYLIPFGASCFEISIAKAERQSIGTGALAKIFGNERRMLTARGVDSPEFDFLTDGRIGIALHGYSDTAAVRKLFAPQPRLTFHLVDESVSADDIANGRVPPGDKLLDQPTGRAPARIAVRSEPFLSGEHIVEAVPAQNKYNGVGVVEARLDTQGKDVFANVTRNSVGHRIAVVLDDRVIEAPAIRDPILGGIIEIDGRFTQKQAMDLATILRADASAPPLKIVELRSLSANK